MAPSEALRRAKKVCPKKLRFTFEEAAQKMGSYPSDLTMYICPKCGYIHFGHVPKEPEKYRR